MKLFAATCLAALAIIAAGCGTQDPAFCSSSCAKVTGRVLRCGGPAPGRCSAQPVASVALDVRGRAIETAFPAQGHALTSFSFTAPDAGHYTLETSVDGQKLRRNLTLAAGQTTRANLIEQIK